MERALFYLGWPSLKPRHKRGLGEEASHSSAEPSGVADIPSSCAVHSAQTTASRPPIIFSQGGNPKVSHPTSPLAPGRSRTRGLPWEGLGCAAMAREKRCRDKPTTSTKRSGQFPRGVIPKRGYVTQRSGVPPSPKSNFAAFSGKGHEAIFEFHASPLPGGSPRRRISLALLQPTPGDSTRAAARWCERIRGRF